MDEHTPFGEASTKIFPARHDLKKKLIELVEKHHVREEFLIPGLYFYLTEHFRSDAEGTNESINWHLNRIRQFEEELAKPREERENRLADVDIQGFIKHLQRQSRGHSWPS